MLSDIEMFNAALTNVNPYANLKDGIWEQSVGGFCPENVWRYIEVKDGQVIRECTKEEFDQQNL